MHRNCPIPQHGFRACCRDGNIITLFREDDVSVRILFNIGIGFPTRERIFEMPHMARNFDIFDLKIRNRRFEMRIPIDQALATIDQTFVIHFNKDLDHRIMEISALVVWRIRRP